MTPLVAILYYLGKCALRGQPGSHSESQTAGNSLSSHASISTNPWRSREADSWKASLFAVPFLCYCLHVGRERQWFIPAYEKHLLGSQCQPWQLGSVYDNMATAVCDFMFSQGPWQNFVILQMPYRLIKTCFSIEVTCLALALSVKSHPLVVIHVSLPSLGVNTILWLKILSLWTWQEGYSS